jgi:hypothetical protein
MGAALVASGSVLADDVTITGSPSGVPGLKGGDATGTLPPPGAAATYNNLTVTGGGGGNNITNISVFGADGGDAVAIGATSASSATGNQIIVHANGGSGGTGFVIAGPLFSGAVSYLGDGQGGAGGNVIASSATGSNLLGPASAYIEGNGGPGGTGDSTIEGIAAHGGIGGTVTGVAAIATGVTASAQAIGNGGAGGIASGVALDPFDPTTGGIGGAASGTTASATSTGGDAAAYVTQTGGNGGSAGPGLDPPVTAGGPGSVQVCLAPCGSGPGHGATTLAIGPSAGKGGVGADSYLTGAVSGSAIGGNLTLNQTANGGGGGTSAGPNGVGGAGGFASSVLTPGAALTGETIFGVTSANGGAGGNGSFGSSGGPGGGALSTIAISGGSNTVNATANATGGLGGGAAGSVASGMVNVTGTNGPNGTAIASATANASPGQKAFATANALGAGGFSKSIATTQDGGPDTASASSTAFYSGSDVSNTAYSAAGVGSSGSSVALNPVGIGGPRNSGTAVVLLPDASFVQNHVTAGKTVDAGIKAAEAGGGFVVGYGQQQMQYQTGGLGPQTFSETVSFTFSTVGLPAADVVYLGTTGSTALGTGFDSAVFTAAKDGIVGGAADTVTLTLTGTESLAAQGYGESFFVFVGPVGIAGGAVTDAGLVAPGAWVGAAGVLSANTFFFDPVYSLGGIDQSFANSAVPEASTWAMMLAGFACLCFAGYGKARKGSAFAA